MQVIWGSPRDGGESLNAVSIAENLSLCPAIDISHKLGSGTSKCVYGLVPVGFH